jgi:hypothetical protein
LKARVARPERRNRIPARRARPCRLPARPAATRCHPQRKRVAKRCADRRCGPTCAEVHETRTRRPASLSSGPCWEGPWITVMLTYPPSPNGLYAVHRAAHAARYPHSGDVPVRRNSAGRQMHIFTAPRPSWPTYPAARYGQPRDVLLPRCDVLARRAVCPFGGVASVTKVPERAGDAPLGNHYLYRRAQHKRDKMHL